MEEYYGHNDWRDYLAHSWGDSPKQKAREKEYNHEYWLKNKARIMRQRGTRSLGNAEYYDPSNRPEGRRRTDGGVGLSAFRRPPIPGQSNAGTNYDMSDSGTGTSNARREIAALKAQNAANYQQNQARREIAALKAQNAANYQAQQQAQNQAAIARHKAANVAAAKKGYQSSGGNNINDSGTGTSYATTRQNQINNQVSRHKAANVAAAKKGRDALNYLLQ